MLAEMGILKSVDDRSIVLLFFSSSDAEKKNRIISINVLKHVPA